MKKKYFVLGTLVILIVLVMSIIHSWRFFDYGNFSVIKSDDGIEHEYVSINNIRLNVAHAGPKDGSPVILLHGYPDAHFGWRDQIVGLAKAGFRVIAPDQRGYNLSDKPRGIDSYLMNLLVLDIIALADHYKFQKFNLAGHDFGGIVSWHLADKYSKRLNHLAIFNAPHPKVIMRFQEENEKQRKKSWYAYFFKIPIIPEVVTQSANWKMLSTALGDSYTKDEVNEYRRAWSQPGANSATINWYRALFKFYEETQMISSIIDVPTLVIWGKKDPHIMWQSAKPSAEMTTNGKVVYIDNATHWVLRDAPHKTTQYLIKFFSEKL